MKTNALRMAASYCLLISSLTAGPFGLEMGMKPDKISGLKATNAPGRYQTESPPSPHPLFKTYVLMFSETSGLYGVTALTESIPTNPFGEQLRTPFATLEKALTTKYGKPDRYDYVTPGSVWIEPNDWLMGLLKEERTLTCEWNLKKIKMPDNLDLIQLKAIGMSFDQGILRLTYWFTNSDAAEAENKKKHDSAL